MTVGAGQLVRVTLKGQAANVFLVDDKGYSAYVAGEEFEHKAGGHQEKSPVLLKPPAPGDWHLVIDLGGFEGEVNASVALQAE